MKFNQSVIELCSSLLATLRRFIKQSVIKLHRKLAAVLKKTIKQSVKDDVLQITFNYRDSSYRREPGGASLLGPHQQKDASNEIELCYYGNSCAELSRELDFDFSSAMFSVSDLHPSSMIARIVDIFKLWLYNFLNYLKYGVFDQIRLSA